MFLAMDMAHITHLDLPKYSIISCQKQYDPVNKSENEVQSSRTYLPRKYYNLYMPNDITIGSSKHFKDLNEKFQELESKMLEIQKCFKEANRVDMEEVERLNDICDVMSPTEGVRRIKKLTKPHRFGGAESRKVNEESTSNGNISHTWTRINKPAVTDEKTCENRIPIDGSGDALQSEATSQASCKTMIKSFDKSPIQPNRHGAKGLFIINKIDNAAQRESSKLYNLEEDNKSVNVDLLEKSKKLILDLIDKELKKIEVKPNHFVTSTIHQVAKKSDDLRQLKIECINNIEKE